ncbi:hypothetical protein QOZ80_3BG0267330 [Eleusine coracana subsp. coracana]|nr:hypothetical protein QOZ80_3BG0267330 [Eleusine coracana subsp. coracana]
MPVCGRGEDYWAWEAEKHGNYSVKSAYRLLEAGRGTSENEASGSAAMEWRQPWKLDVPPKVRVFWRRVLHGYLPAKEVLHHCHVEKLPHCDTRGADEESIHHVLLECTMARMFWSQMKDLFGVKLPKLRQDSWPWDLLSDSVCSGKNRAVIICGMWALWTLQNKRRHGEPEWPLQQAVFWARDTTFDL